MSLAASRLGYGLLDIFEVGAALGPDQPTYSSIEIVATRLDVQVLLTRGRVDQGRLEQIAERMRLRVIALDDREFSP